jgi:hypothetical protein
LLNKLPADSSESFFIIKEFSRENAWPMTCHDHRVAEETIIIDDEQLARTRKVLDCVRRERAEDAGECSYVVPTCDASINQASQVRINVNARALSLEYEPGFFDFLFNRARMRRVALDRFTVEIAAEAPAGAVPGLVDEMSALSEIIQSCHFPGNKDQSLGVHTTKSDSLDIWA